jgi:hypothetical protein
VPFVRIPDAGKVGLNKDLSNHELPINAWTDARNVRFLNGYAWQMFGYGEVFNTAQVVPHHVMPVVIGTARYWLYASLEKIYAVTLAAGTAVHTNRTRQTAAVDVNYAATPNSWTSTLIGGIPILNNGVDPPQAWDLNLANRFVALPGWPANTTCKSMRGFRSFLVALNITEAGTNYPFMVRTSHPADPGSVPASWDYTDPTVDALRFDLAQGYDPIVDGFQLRDSLMVYKEASVWRIDFVGGQFVDQVTKVLGTSGALNRNCIVEVDGFQVVLTNSDVIAHDGQSPWSILDRQTRRWLFQNMDVDGVYRAFVFKNPFFNEVCIAFPSVGSNTCDKALVWNYVEKTVSIRDVPNIHHANFGPTDVGLLGNWAQDPAPWQSDLTLWDSPDFVPSAARVLMGSDGPKLYMLDSSSSFDGAVPTVYLERRGLSFDAPERIKLVRGLRPRVVGNTGDTVKFRVGGQDDPWGEPTWSDEMVHTIGSTTANDCFVSGRYITIRWENGTAFSARLDSIDIDVEMAGNW